MVDHLPFVHLPSVPRRGQPGGRRKMRQQPTIEDTASNPGMPAKVVVAAVLGTVLEWYDFAIYAALAVVIGRLFFPAASPTTSLLIALATYAVGFVCRP